MSRRPVHPRRTAAAVVLTFALASTAACSTDTVVTGERPNKPQGVTSAKPDSQTDPSALWLDPTTLPSYQEAGQGDGGASTRSLTDADGKVSWRVLGPDGKAISTADSPKVAFGDSSTYTTVPGVLTFRGNNFRNGGAYGKADMPERKMEIAWKKQIPEIRGEGSYWPGAGWTGQPLLVQWPDATRAAMGLPKEFDKPGFVEAIYPVFGGKIYRLDLASGKEVRDPIEVGWGFKGTASVDPRGYPLLFAGQGLNDTNGTIGPWRFRAFDLIQNKEVWHISGLDPLAPRHDWGAFDSSTLINRETDTLIEPAENGLIYKAKLNTKFDAAAKKVSIAPELQRLRYTTPNSQKYGIENSAVAYRNLMFAADNDGNVFCWDATTLQILWMREVGDDTDASIVLDETPDGVFLYTGNEVDNRGKTGGERITNLRKIDALSGREIWRHDIPAYFDAGVNGGLLGTPVVGKGEFSDLVFFNVARTTAPREGDLLALDKASGNVVWRRHLTNYSWSSPTMITATDDKQFLVLPDSDGVVHMIDPATGLDVSSLKLGGKNTEATISAFGNMMVVASYDRNIYGIRLK